MKRSIAPIEWNEEFSVGVHEMDNQHHMIVSLINELIVHSESESENLELMSEVLARMFEYSTSHFLNEERLLSHHNYPGLSMQKADHRHYLVTTGILAARTGENSVSSELLDFLRNWWVHHILVEDMRYKSFMQA